MQLCYRKLRETMVEDLSSGGVLASLVPPLAGLSYCVVQAFAKRCATGEGAEVRQVAGGFFLFLFRFRSLRPGAYRYPLGNRRGFADRTQHSYAL